MTDSSPVVEMLYKCSISLPLQQCLKAPWYPDMRGLSFVLLVLLLMLAVGEGNEPEMQYWTCGYRGLCRRFCYAQEYTVGHHGCPRRYRCCATRHYYLSSDDVTT